MRAESTRGEVARLVRQAPFRAFLLDLENGDRVTIGHPENIAFDPAGDSADFFVIAGKLRLFGSFGAVANVATVDSTGPFA